MNNLLLKSFGEIVTVCGALLIFFNWVMTNIFVEKMKDKVDIYKRADEKKEVRDLTDKLQLLFSNTSAENVITKTILDRISLEISRDRRDKVDDDYYFKYLEMHNQIGATSTNSRQIDGFYNLSCRDLEHAIAVSKNNETVQTIRSNSRHLKDAVDRKNRLIGEMWGAIRGIKDGADAEDAWKKLNVLSNKYRETLNEFTKRTKLTVDLTNRLSQEINSEILFIKKRTKTVKKISLYLYITGTALTLYGTIVSKVING